MTLHYTDDAVTLYAGDCLDVMRQLPDASVDAVVTDPPYGLGFMGKAWDAEFIASTTETRRQYVGDPDPRAGENGGYRSAASEAGRYDLSRSGNLGFQQWCNEWATEALRVLKPGGHLLAFGGTRTWHRLACAIEDAGFEVRDSIAWMYGSGFPKSLDVSKAIDKDAGHWRGKAGAVVSENDAMGAPNYERTPKGDPITAAAAAWQGWGTALKPAFEPIVVARKPLIGTVAENVLRHGTGAINVDGGRVGTSGATKWSAQTEYGTGGWRTGHEVVPIDGGRWPANVILDESQAAELDRQSGVQRDGVAVNRNRTADNDRATYSAYQFGQKRGGDITYGGEVAASRFFYIAKADSSERPRVDGIAHPTVKPLDLMRYLVRLVTPPGGVVLEPFAGSGTTLEACIIEGFRCIGIEREADYLSLILQRITKPIEVTLL